MFVLFMDSQFSLRLGRNRCTPVRGPARLHGARAEFALNFDQAVVLRYASLRHTDPVLICPTPVAAARSAIVGFPRESRISMASSSVIFDMDPLCDGFGNNACFKDSNEKVLDFPGHGHRTQLFDGPFHRIRIAVQNHRPVFP